MVEIIGVTQHNARPQNGGVLTLWLYCKAVGRVWWALMSCAAFTALGVYVLYTNKSNQWAVRATFALSGLFLLVACFVAWLEEHRNVETHEAELRRLKLQYFGERPRVTFAVKAPRTVEEWRQLESVVPPPMFRLEHSGGRVARFVKIDPVQSLSGRFRLQFDQAPVLNDGYRQQQAITFTVYQNGPVSDLSSSADILRIQQGVNMLLQFLRDHPLREKESVYDITVRYHDQDGLQQYIEQFALKCLNERMLLSVEPNLLASSVPN